MRFQFPKHFLILVLLSPGKEGEPWAANKKPGGGNSPRVMLKPPLLTQPALTGSSRSDRPLSALKARVALSASPSASRAFCAPPHLEALALLDPSPRCSVFHAVSSQLTQFEPITSPGISDRFPQIPELQDGFVSDGEMSRETRLLVSQVPHCFIWGRGSGRVGVTVKRH